MTDQLILNATEIFCALDSLEAAEPIFGTASTETTIWFLLEYPESWAYDAVKENNLHPYVQQWLKEQLTTFTQSRLLFIKKEGMAPRPTRRLYLAITREQDQRLYSFELANYEELMDLDVAGIIAEDGGYDHYLSQETLYLVCTNGKRDKCCAKFGRPLYHALANLDDAHVWQATHIGGHRYAPTLGVFPQGIYYGQVQPQEAAALKDAIDHQQIVLDHYRGRTCYTAVVQAADFYVRQQTVQLAADAFSHTYTRAVGENQWEVRFQGTAQQHTVTVLMTLSEPVVASCTNFKRKPRPIYQLLHYDAS